MPEDMIPVLSKAEISQKVKGLAQRISEDYTGKELIVLGVLKGCFIFLADLIREMNIPVQVDFVRLASYGSNTTSSGTIRITKEAELDIRDRDVLIVEDIIDSGATIAYLLDHLKSFSPKSVKICAFIDKSERREVQVSIDYAGIMVEQGFLVGYGLDFDEKYRALPAIYRIGS